MTMRDLLIPITVEYPLSECMMIEERKDLLKEVGIDLEPLVMVLLLNNLPMWMNLRKNCRMDGIPISGKMAVNFRRRAPAYLYCPCISEKCADHSFR